VVKFLQDTKNYYERKELAAIRDNEIAEWEIAIAEWNDRKKKKLVYKLDEPFEDANGKKQIWSEPRPPKPRVLSVPNKPVKPELKMVGGTRKITPQMVQWEGQICGLFISRHPLDFVTPPATIEYNRIADISPTENKRGSLLVAVSAIETRAIKSGPQRGKKMATITIEDQEDVADMTLFAGPYEN
jgi:DNA polymerase III alpha subunit